MSQQRVVLCMKWGSLYPAEYVNVLYRACCRNISTEFRFVCLTGEAEGLLPEIEVYPIPDFGLEHRHYYDGAWPKIGVFSSHLYGLKGRCLFIDLDTVILDNIDPLFEVPGSLVAINNAPWSNPKISARTMSSVFSFDIGSLGYVVERLQANRDTLIAQHKIEQEYLHHVVEGIQYWPQEWLVSFKYHLRQPLFFDRFRPPKAPPAKVKLVIFHGKPRPIDLVISSPDNWERFPHYGKGTVDWMVRYWAENSEAF